MASGLCCLEACCEAWGPYAHIDRKTGCDYSESMLSYGRKRFCLIASRRMTSAVLGERRSPSDEVVGDI